MRGRVRIAARRSSPPSSAGKKAYLIELGIRLAFAAIIIIIISITFHRFMKQGIGTAQGHAAATAATLVSQPPSTRPFSHGERRIVRRPLENRRAGMALIFRPCLCVMAKRLRDVCGLPESKTALARRTRLRRPRPAVDGGEAARHPAV